MTSQEERIDKALDSLSHARTALDDPGGLSAQALREVGAYADSHSWLDAHAAYAIDKIDDAMRLLSPEKRTVLVHLNVQVPAHDQREPREIADAIHGALDVGSDDEVRHLVVTIPLVEEVL